MESNDLKVIMCKGAPACGKSTWTNIFIQENPNYVEVNRDNIRLKEFGRESMYRGDEKRVSEIQYSLIRGAFSLGFSVVVSDCNLNSSVSSPILKIAAECGAQVEWKDFTDVPLEVLLERDSKREFPVGASVIKRQYYKYIMGDPHYREPYLKPQDTSLPKAAIFDVDGTLTLGPNKRSPYDMSKVSQDEPNLYTINMLEMFSSNPQMYIFIFSGREEKARLDTMEWLFKHTANFRHAVFGGRVEMFMRPDSDGQSDAILKQDFYNEHVKDKCHVIAVFDDRLRVAKVWHELGLPLFRVGDPSADF